MNAGTGVVTAPTPHDDRAFIRARDEFLSLLSPSEQSDFSSCQSLTDLMRNLEKFQQIRNGGDRIKRGLKKVQAFGRNLEPYFHIMEIFCGAHPEWANIAFGSLQLVLQAADSYLTQELKRTPVVVTSLMWRPFDSRFTNILNKIKLDQNIIKEELQFASMGELKTTVQDASMQERAAMLAALNNIQAFQTEQAQEQLWTLATKWLNPPSYKAALEQAQDQRTQGTNEWLRTNPQFARWRSAASQPGGTSSQMLWICGNPGSGKTVLAASLIRELKDDSPLGTDSLPEVCYYFFSQNSGTRNSPVDAYRAIATQILESFNEFEKISNLYALGVGQRVIQQEASENEVLDTIAQCLPHLPDLFLVVDAIDECSYGDRLIRQLLQWCESSPLKVVVLSRPDVAFLRRSIPKERRIELRGAQVNNDIGCYLELEVKTLVQEGLLSEDVDRVEIVSHLVARAEGMFLWARLIVGYLNGPAMTRAQRLAIIMERNTEGLDQLDEMYKRIENRIHSLDPHSKRLSQNTLMWVAHVRISSEALKDALFPEGWDMEPKGVSEQFEHAVIVSCGGLIEKRPRDGGGFRYIHLTALEFVQNRNSRLLRHPREPLIPSGEISKAMIVMTCIASLEAIPQRPLSGRLGEATSTSSVLGQWPILEVATNWMDLSIDAVTGTSISSNTTPNEVLRMAECAARFLTNRLSLMVWVEAWYCLTYGTQKVDLSEPRFTSLRDRLPDTRNLNRHERVEQYLSTLQDFVNDLIQLEAAWGSVLKGSPHDIWGDVTVFNKSRFFVSTKAASAQCLAPEMIAGKEEFNTMKAVKPTFSVSMSSADGRRVAVLAIFPCE
ncbi:hypothetical protein N0V82_010086 [Gnomoniopsis sp. IMI 355080]|nr:hypothetical protein N0V82_010086 [Gnomoniopsis sp. IMI 355080]